METPSESTSVLSIQSHVTHGYVGNKAATFPLQLHGFDVDAVNTVSLSNHSGYPVIRGHRMDLDEFKTILSGLRENGFLSGYQYVLTGYINNAEIIQHVEEIVNEIRRLRVAAGQADVMFVCDPVMGDDGRLYCKEEAIDAYRALLHAADIATPNGFEASVLSGVEVTDMATALQAANWFHAQGTATVVIKSFNLAEDPAHIRFLLSTGTRDAATGTVDVSKVRRFTGAVPFHEGRYTGTGDVFAASLVAFVHANPLDIAVAKSMAVVQDLILATMKRGGLGEASLNARELRVTSSPESLLRPTAIVQISELKD